MVKEFNTTAAYLIPAAVDWLTKGKTFRATTDNKTLFVYNEDTGVFESNVSLIVEAQIQQFMGEDTRNFMVKEVVDTIKRLNPEERENFDSKKDWVNLKNGMLNLNNKELVPHSPEFLSLKQVPVTYNPEADCPNFKKFLSEVVSLEDGKDIMRFWGATLAPHCRFEKAIVFVGEGENGKSVMLYAVTEFFKRVNTSSESLQSLCDNTFRKAELFGKIANIKSELAATKVSQVDDFKSLVSGIDTITGERKRKDPFKFLNTAKLWFSCNELPTVSFSDKAYYRRWIVIKFPNTFQKCSNADNNLGEKLISEEEKSGILNMALNGYSELEKDGGFINWNDAAKTRLIYNSSAGDTVSKFSIECLEESLETVITKDAFYEEYKAFCSKIKKFPLAHDNFYRSLWGINEREGRVIYARTKEGTGTSRDYSIKGWRVKR